MCCELLDLFMCKIVVNVICLLLFFVGLLFVLLVVGIDLMVLGVFGGVLGVGLGFGF